MTIPDPPPRIDTEAKDFLLKEFEVVRTEHDALDARLVTIIQYLLLFSATIYYFLLTAGRCIANNFPMAKVMVWSLPTIASIIAFLYCLLLHPKSRQLTLTYAKSNVYLLTQQFYQRIYQRILSLVGNTSGAFTEHQRRRP